MKKFVLLTILSQRKNFTWSLNSLILTFWTSFMYSVLSSYGTSVSTPFSLS